MLNAADKILIYLEDEVKSTESFLQKFGYLPLQDPLKIKPSRENSISDEAKQDKKSLNDESLSANIEVKPAADVEAISENDTTSEEPKEENHRYFALPKSPESPLFSANFKRDSLHSPEAPTMDSKQSQAKLLNDDNFGEPADAKGNPKPRTHFDELPQSPCLPIALDKKTEESGNLPSTRFFDTPGIDKCKLNDHVRNLPANMPFFTKLTASPDSPQTANIESEIASPDLTLFSRRSVLLDVPERASTIDDDTVYHLKGGRQMSQFMQTPESPELADFKGFPKIESREENGKLPETPQGPELTTHTNFRIKLENVDHESSSEESMYRIKESQYQGLPDYLKRVIPYNVASKCLRKVLDSSFSLPGEKYSSVTTEATISEVTNLAGKTKSFILLMQSLKIIQRIRGTEYFEFII